MPFFAWMGDVAPAGGLQGMRNSPPPRPSQAGGRAAGGIRARWRANLCHPSDWLPAGFAKMSGDNLGDLGPVVETILRIRAGVVPER